MTIKAIETSYKGYRFRSRLEARWAVFFDAAGIAFKYEPEGFEKSWTHTDTEGNDTVTLTQYLPDFYLPGSNTWVEVKGSSEMLQRDCGKLSEILDWNSPLPGVQDSATTLTSHGLLILGDIPYTDDFGIILHPLIQHHKGLVKNWAHFTPGNEQIEGGIVCSDHPRSKLCELFGLPEIEACIGHEPRHWTVESHFVKTKRAWGQIRKAYAAARSARFEHGQYGAAA